MNEREFLEKIAWEGSVFDALDSGLRVSDLDDQTTELAHIWHRLHRLYTFEFEPLVEQLEDLIPDGLTGAP